WLPEAYCWRQDPTKFGKIRACAKSIWVVAMADLLLELKDVRSGYGEAVVLDGVSVNIPAGGSLAVLGRNGVGKTTFLLTIIGVVRLLRGSVLFKGADVSRLTPDKRALAGIGWVPQEREVFPSLTVEENLTVVGRPGRWDLEAVYNLFPRLKARRANTGTQPSGGGQEEAAVGQARTGRHRLGAAGARGVPVAHCRGEPHRRWKAGTLGPRSRLQSLPAPEGAAGEHGQSTFRRRAADARHRTDAHDQSVNPASGRAARR